jgi:hypothetical protein
MVTDVSAVNDFRRTRWIPSDASTGAWSFGRLMTEMAPAGSTPAQVSAFVLNWLNQWKTITTLNGLPVPPRPQIDQIITAWPRNPDGTLDLTRPPMRLLAMVYRPDLAGAPESTKAGEGRFVFGVFQQSPSDPFNGPSFPFTVILEYNLDKRVMPQNEWDKAALALSSSPTVDEAYKVKLEQLTRSFSFRNAALTDVPNQSPISQVRSNENRLNPLWELREFHLGANGQLAQAPVVNTPDISFSAIGSAAEARLVRWIAQNQDAILLGKHDLPNSFENLPFRGPTAAMPGGFRWTPSSVPEAVRRQFSLNTCNGCHSGETGTPFLHVNPRPAGAPTFLSAFTQNDLLARKQLVEERVIEANCHP